MVNIQLDAFKYQNVAGKIRAKITKRGITSDTKTNRHKTIHLCPVSQIYLESIATSTLRCGLGKIAKKKEKKKKEPLHRKTKGLCELLIR